MWVSARTATVSNRPSGSQRTCIRGCQSKERQPLEARYQPGSGRCKQRQTRQHSTHAGPHLIMTCMNSTQRTGLADTDAWGTCRPIKTQCPAPELSWAVIIQGPQRTPQLQNSLQCVQLHEERLPEKQYAQKGDQVLIRTKVLTAPILHSERGLQPGMSWHVILCMRSRGGVGEVLSADRHP